jgi:hypothetical protein
MERMIELLGMGDLNVLREIGAEIKRTSDYSRIEEICRLVVSGFKDKYRDDVIRFLMQVFPNIEVNVDVRPHILSHERVDDRCDIRFKGFKQWLSIKISSVYELRKLKVNIRGKVKINIYSFLYIFDADNRAIPYFKFQIDGDGSRGHISSNFYIKYIIKTFGVKIDLPMLK